MAEPAGLLPQALDAVTTWTTDIRALAAEWADVIASAGDLLWPSPKDIPGA